MRKIYKVVDKTVDGKMMQFRLKKLDAFSGAGLLRMIAGTHEGNTDLMGFFVRLPEDSLRRLMCVCLEHVEVMLPAGWNPVMTRGEWSWQEAEHDTMLCMQLTLEEALWTLQGFFGGSDSKPPGAEAAK